MYGFMAKNTERDNFQVLRLFIAVRMVVMIGLFSTIYANLSRNVRYFPFTCGTIHGRYRGPFVSIVCGVFSTPLALRCQAFFTLSIAPTCLVTNDLPMWGLIILSVVCPLAYFTGIQAVIFHMTIFSELGKRFFHLAFFTAFSIHASDYTVSLGGVKW